MVFKAGLELGVVRSLTNPGDGQERMLAVLHVFLHGSVFSRSCIHMSDVSLQGKQ